MHAAASVSAQSVTEQPPKAMAVAVAGVCMQVKVNLLQLECLSAAGRWQEARRHVEALHRSLPVAKQRGPAAAAALEAIAGWRATCLVEASTRALEEMPRLLSELNTPQAKVRCHSWLLLLWQQQGCCIEAYARSCVTHLPGPHRSPVGPTVGLPGDNAEHEGAHYQKQLQRQHFIVLSWAALQARAWLAFAQATPSIAEQLQARQSALAALDTLPPEAKVQSDTTYCNTVVGTLGTK